MIEKVSIVLSVSTLFMMFGKFLYLVRENGKMQRDQLHLRDAVKGAHLVIETQAEFLDQANGTGKFSGIARKFKTTRDYARYKHELLNMEPTKVDVKKNKLFSDKYTPRR